MLYLSLTLLNFGILCKTTYLHFPTLVANCSDKSYDLLKKILDPIQQSVESLLHHGKLWIESLQKFVKIDIRLGKQNN